MAKCLIIDDNPSNRMVARFIMEDLGLEVGEGGSVEESLTMVASGEYAVILLDWMMPEIDGIEFLELLRESAEGKKIKVIMCTAKDGLANVQAALSAGADAYIQKPITSSIAEEKLRALGVI